MDTMGESPRSAADGQPVDQVAISEKSAVQAPRAHRPLAGVGLAVGGLVAVLVAGIGIVQVSRHGSRDLAFEAESAGLPSPAEAGCERGEMINVRNAEYAPGETTGWHQHQGVHVVTVLSGVLTVEDGVSGVQTFGAGDTYVGGRDAHVARNDGDVPVRMVVTYVLDR